MDYMRLASRGLQYPLYGYRIDDRVRFRSVAPIEQVCGDVFSLCEEVWISVIDGQSAS